MKKIGLSLLVVTATVGVVLFSCKKIALEDNVPDLPTTPYDYSNTNGITVFNGPNNPFSNEKASLGRVLFYDKLLSVNNRIACGSCHLQELGFSDGKQSSEGFLGVTTTPRNSMTIANLQLESSFFWDARANSLEDQATQPIKNHIEMGIENIDLLPNKLGKTSYYANLFSNAYGSSEITSDKIAKALATFLRSMISANSKFDIGENSQFANFSLLEKEGQAIFQSSQCSSCHNLSLGFFGWSGTTIANIGLAKTSDNGAINTFNNPSFENSFKAPTLRNIALTAPYMHDGRFATLNEVIDHYSHNIQQYDNLDWRLQDGNGNAKKFNYTDHQKEALIAFLNTLTDYSYITDKRFSNPFKN